MENESEKIDYNMKEIKLERYSLHKLNTILDSFKTRKDSHNEISSVLVKYTFFKATSRQATRNLRVDATAKS